MPTTITQKRKSSGSVNDDNSNQSKRHAGVTPTSSHDTVHENRQVRFLAAAAPPTSLNLSDVDGLSTDELIRALAAVKAENERLRKKIDELPAASKEGSDRCNLTLRPVVFRFV
jgi:hypothetical protein